MVGAVQLADDNADLVFVTSDGQLLRFGAAAVRPQGRARRGHGRGTAVPGCPRGVVRRRSDDRAGGTGADAVVVTVAGSAGALPGTAAASVKVTPYADFPPKGRGTGGVRCHRFLKGEDALILAWAGPGPARAATDAGVPVDLPDADGRRDGSGEASGRGWPPWAASPYPADTRVAAKRPAGQGAAGPDRATGRPAAAASAASRSRGPA